MYPLKKKISPIEIRKTHKHTRVCICVCRIYNKASPRSPSSKNSEWSFTGIFRIWVGMKKFQYLLICRYFVWHKATKMECLVWFELSEAVLVCETSLLCSFL